MCYDIFCGAVNEDKFNRFVRKRLLKYINPYPGDRSIILLDNISFHHNWYFINIILEFGAVVAHLPHYCPTLNLTEYAFRDIKCIEISKNVYGMREGLISLAESTDKIKHKDYTDILQKIGFIKS